MNSTRTSTVSALGLFTLLLGLTVLAGCPAQGRPEPVEIVLDEDSCAVCRMAVSTKKFAAEIVPASGGAALYFDDIGCLVEYCRSSGIPEGGAAYVVDFNSEGWLDAEGAVYLYSKELPTPMSYGLGAFGFAAEAEKASLEWPGTVIAWNEVLQEFKP